MNPILQGVLIALASAILIDIVMQIFKTVKNKRDKIKTFYNEEQLNQLKQIINDVILNNKLATEKELNSVIRNQEEERLEIIEIKKNIQQVQEDIDTLKDADLADLKNNLLHSYDFCSNRGYTTPEDVDTWFKMYDSYKALHGNSFIDSMAEDFRELPMHGATRRMRNKNNNNNNDNNNDNYN